MPLIIRLAGRLLLVVAVLAGWRPRSASHDRKQCNATKSERPCSFQPSELCTEVQILSRIGDTDTENASLWLALSCLRRLYLSRKTDATQSGFARDNVMKKM